MILILKIIVWHRYWDFKPFFGTSWWLPWNLHALITNVHMKGFKPLTSGEQTQGLTGGPTSGDTCNSKLPRSRMFIFLIWLFHNLIPHTQKKKSCKIKIPSQCEIIDYRIESRKFVINVHQKPPFLACMLHLQREHNKFSGRCWVGYGFHCTRILTVYGYDFWT